jgi:hypothetical protein
MRIVTALSAGGLAVGLALTPMAAGAAPADVTLPSGGVLEKRVDRFCDRVPQLIVRADKAQARISGDADTKGSLAWLKARRAKAEAKKGKHHERVVKRLDRRIERRTDRLAKLPQVRKNLQQAKTECAEIDRSAPTPAPSASGS